MKSLMSFSLVLKLVLLPSCSMLSLSNAENFDFFYFVEQWPGSYCDTRRHCCYPKTGKPAADFSIHGLWPNYNSGRYPSNCDPDNHYNASAVDDLKKSMQQNWPTLSCPPSDGTTFWTHQWEKHGTCAKSILDQHAYFQAALNLRKKVNLLQALKDVGIKPDGQFYTLDRIKSAIRQETGFTPGVGCNVDDSGNIQLFHVYMCADTSGTNLIQCPVLPRTKCRRRIVFPAF